MENQNNTDAPAENEGVILTTEDKQRIINLIQQGSSIESVDAAKLLDVITLLQTELEGMVVLLDIIKQQYAAYRASIIAVGLTDAEVNTEETRKQLLNNELAKVHTQLVAHFKTVIQANERRTESTDRQDNSEPTGESPQSEADTTGEE